MKIGEIEVNLNEQEIELLRMVHPLFMGLSFREAAEELQWSPTTVTKVWKQMVAKYPMLEETLKKWDNPYGIRYKAVKYPRGFSDLENIADDDCDSDDDTFFGGKIRMKF